MTVEQELNISPINVEARRQADIRTGDRVRVHTKIVEKGKTRTQPFEGLVIARKHGTEPGASFTVRRTTGEYGVERVFPLYSPNIQKIEVLRRSKVRQSNIYHIRDKVTRQIRREMRRMMLINETAADDSLPEEPAEAGETEETSKETGSKKEESGSESVGQEQVEASTDFSEKAATSDSEGAPVAAEESADK